MDNDTLLAMGKHGVSFRGISFLFFSFLFIGLWFLFKISRFATLLRYTLYEWSWKLWL
jgi:hypothetical protein